MARALECPACGHRHRVESLPGSATFRCERCGQVLKAPAPVSSQPDAPPPPARGFAAPAGGAAAATGAPSTRVPPPRRTNNAPTGGGTTRAVPVRTAAGVSATVSATAPASDGNINGTSDRRRGKPAPGPAPAKRSKVRWYWRVVAWIVAVPLAFLVTAWPAYKLGFIKKNDLLNIFVGTGTGRYLRLVIVTLVWAIVTALLVQLLVEGGRVRANRRRARAAAG
jgi:hypothetical protein